MASGTRKKEQQTCSCKVFLNGKVAPHVQANIVKEMLKHLMFQRNQIPLTYEQMNFEYQRHSTENGKKKGHQELTNLTWKRLGQFIASLEEQLANIDTLFTLSFVPRVLILFGATAISPKEAHEIVFVNQASVHDSSLTELRTKHCMQALMRTLIADSSIWEAKQLPLTNTLLLVQAHRNSGLTWFKPKIALKVPRRGPLYRSEIHCGRTCGADRGHDDCAQEDGIDDGCPALRNIKNTEDEVSARSLAEDDDYIWYQAPAPIKGMHSFLPKTSPPSSSIWA